MTKKELISILKYNLEVLEKLDDNKEFNLIHTIDKGGYVDDSYEISDFNLDFSYDEDDDVLYISYVGEEV